MDDSWGSAAFSFFSISSISRSPSPMVRSSRKSALIATNTLSGAVWMVRTWLTAVMAGLPSTNRYTSATTPGSARSPISSPFASRARNTATSASTPPIATEA